MVTNGEQITFFCQIIAFYLNSGLAEIYFFFSLGQGWIVFLLFPY